MHGGVHGGVHGGMHGSDVGPEARRYACLCMLLQMRRAGGCALAGCGLVRTRADSRTGGCGLSHRWLGRLCHQTFAGWLRALCGAAFTTASNYGLGRVLRVCGWCGRGPVSLSVVERSARVRCWLQRVETTPSARFESFVRCGSGREIMINILSDARTYLRSKMKYRMRDERPLSV